MKKEALFYKTEGNKVRCLLCPHNCLIPDGNTGICGVRYNEGNTLYTKNYSVISAIARDPIEKKPLYNFYPGSNILSLGTYGCNLNCVFCQNWSISQKFAEGQFLNPDSLVSLIKRHGGIGIAYTYNEPTIWYEFIKDSAPLVKAAGYKNVLVTNGFINIEPLSRLIPYIDAFNVDIKGFNEDFYKNSCGGMLKSVLSTISFIYKKAHIELTHLVVTGLNDDIDSFSNMVDYISRISKKIPLHISRYHPDHNYSAPPTSIELLNKFYDIASKKLDFVYLGNISDITKNSTFCPQCGKVIIERNGYSTVNRLANKKCPYCDNEVSNIIV